MNLQKHLFLEISNGNGGIPISSPKDIPELKDQEVSDLVWFPVQGLYLRSDSLRLAGEPIKISTPDNPHGILSSDLTPPLREIAVTYDRFPDFNGEPILCCYESLPKLEIKVLLVYEGRHRSIAARMAKRTFILGKHICQEYSAVRSQKSPEKTKYFNKPIFPIDHLVELYTNDPKY